MKKENEEAVVEKILKERIKGNENLFTKKEREVISENLDIFLKIYLIGILDKSCQ